MLLHNTLSSPKTTNLVRSLTRNRACSQDALMATWCGKHYIRHTALDKCLQSLRRASTHCLSDRR